MDYSILGPVRLITNGTSRPIRSRNLAVILTTLLVRARNTATVAELVGEVWPQRPPKRARDALYVHISKLRQELGDNSQYGVIASQFPGYLMHVRDDQLDLHSFLRRRLEGQRLMADGEYRLAALSWQAGLSLCRGQVLDKSRGGPILGSFDSWLRQSSADCVEMAAWSQLRAGLHYPAIDFLSLHLMQYPLNEILYQQLMLAYFLSNHRAQALDVFHKAFRVLSDDLGVSPCQDLQSMQKIVLNDDVDLAERVLFTAVESRVSNLRPHRQERVQLIPTSYRTDQTRPIRLKGAEPPCTPSCRP